MMNEILVTGYRRKGHNENEYDRERERMIYTQMIPVHILFLFIILFTAHDIHRNRGNRFYFIISKQRIKNIYINTNMYGIHTIQTMYIIHKCQPQLLFTIL